MIEYYRAVAPVLLPHLRRRPLTLWRFPAGVQARGWWQNECRGAPAWLATVTIRGQRFCVVDDVRSLVWVANLGTVELHPFLARAEALDEPTAVVFDLDPGPPAAVVDCSHVALRLRELLAERGLASFPKTSGSAGLHVYVPLNAPHAYRETKAFARSLARALAEELAERIVDRQARALRPGKVLVDWLQNDPTRSTIAPYSLRAMPFPTVSTPLTWEEVESAQRDEDLVFTAPEVVERVERLGDLFDVGGPRPPAPRPPADVD